MDYPFELLERINPVFNTAKMTLFQLANAGDADAKVISGKMGLTLDSTQGEVSDSEMLCNTIILETRYRTMGKLAEETGFTEVDLPCGYTPRAMEFARKGKRFIGLDLPAAISEAGPLITSMIENKELIRFAGVDATNYESLKTVLDEEGGPVCITTEGLLMYFTDSETAQLCDNIRRILDQHGGCWITADPEASIQYVLTSKIIYGDRFMDILLKGQKRTQDKSDVPVKARTLVIDMANVKEAMQNAMVFLAGHGLKAERMIVSDHIPELMSMKGLSDEQRSELAAAMSKFAYWKITPVRQSGNGDISERVFDYKAEIDNGILSLKLNGRLDTLTAPRLLSFFEDIKEQIGGVNVDCDTLDYISSAGLRVLLIMQKKCPVRLRNINDTVSDILEQTGFDSILG